MKEIKQTIILSSIAITGVSLMAFNEVHNYYAWELNIPIAFVSLFLIAIVIKIWEHKPKASKLKLVLTWQCIQLCSYCCNKNLGHVKRLLDFNDVLKYKEVHLTGGDPLIAPHFEEVLYRLNSMYHGKVYIYTSVYFFHNKFTDKSILDYAILNSNGVTYTVHDYFVQHATIRYIIDFLIDNKIPPDKVRFSMPHGYTPLAVRDFGIKWNWTPLVIHKDCPLPKDTHIKSYFDDRVGF